MNKLERTVMFKKLVIFSLIPFVCLIFLTLFIELGFELRKKIEVSVNAHNQPQKQILFIGDSILGFLTEPKSLATQIEGQLKKNTSEIFYATEVSGPALRTRQAFEKVSELVKTSQPSVVILMLGKSDYHHESSPWWSPLSRFRLFRLLEYSYLNLKQKIFHKQQQLSRDLRNQAQPAWDLYGQAHYEEAVPLFEKVIQEGHHDERVLKALLSCYILSQQFDRGIAYFNQIKESHKKSELTQQASEILQNHPGNPKRPEQPTTHIPFSLDTRDRLRFQMWMYQLQNKGEDMMAIFKKFPTEGSTHIHAYTRNNLVEIFNLFPQESTHVFVLQYPLDHVSALQKVLPPLPKNVTFVDLRSLLLEAPPEKFITFWQEDMEHLSTEGNAWVSEKLAPTILKFQRGIQ